MKKNVLKGALIAVLFTVSVLLGVNHTLNQGFSSVVLSNVEALSDDESYSDPVWIVDVKYCEGDLSVDCKTDGDQVCPLISPYKQV